MQYTESRKIPQINDFGLKTDPISIKIRAKTYSCFNYECIAFPDLEPNFFLTVFRSSFRLDRVEAATLPPF